MNVSSSEDVVVHFAYFYVFIATPTRRNDSESIPLSLTYLLTILGQHYGEVVIPHDFSC